MSATVQAPAMLKNAVTHHLVNFRTEGPLIYKGLKAEGMSPYVSYVHVET